MTDDVALATVVGLVPAAGRGERFGAAEVPKQFQLVAGRPLLVWTIERLLAAGLPRLYVAVPGEWAERAAAELTNDPRVVWVVGGAARQESVACCLRASRVADEAAASGGERAQPDKNANLVLVHDGARPLTAVQDIRATIFAAGETGAAVLGRPVADTLKRVRGGWVEATVSREELFRAETPQVFRRDLLERAFERADRDGRVATDEAGLIEQLGDVPLRAVTATAVNPKLTHPADRRLVELLLQTDERTAGLAGRGDVFS